MMGKCLIIVQEVLLVSLVGLRQSLIDKCVYKDSVRTLWMGSMEVNQSFMELYGRNVFLKVGNGNKIKFWRDGWIDQIPLSESFPDLFSICNNPEARVCECWTTQGWDLIFRKLMNDWEVDRVASFLGKLGETNLVTNAPDRVIWKHSKDDKFTVNNAYEKGIQVGLEIKCLTSIRDNESKDMAFYAEEENMEMKSEETSLPRLSSYHSFASTEDSLGRESFSSQSDSNRHGNLIIGRQESLDSRSSASCGSYSFCESPKSYNSPYNLMISGSGKNAQNKEDDFKQFSHDNTASVQLSASSRNSLQAKDTTN